MAADVQVLQPPPGVDIDRSTATGQVIDQQGMAGWYPHEGGLMEYRVAIRFGQEPHTMPEGWSFGRVSAVATDSNGQVFVFHRGETADPIVVFDAEGIMCVLLVEILILEMNTAFASIAMTMSGLQITGTTAS